MSFTYLQAVSGFSPLRCSLDASQDDEAPKDDCPVRSLASHSTADYAWDHPTAENKRIRLVADGVPLPRTFDMMAIGIQPPIKLAVGGLPSGYGMKPDSSSHVSPARGLPLSPSIFKRKAGLKYW